MSFQSVMFRFMAAISDYNRDRTIALPEDVTACRNIAYTRHGKWNLLDVYYPNDAAASLPTIVSIHGGGYVHGTKENYRRYGMDMARRGFAFVNFNYRLAPKWHFPAPLRDTNSVMKWICKNAARYHLDPSRIILTGCSAGAQLASQYAAIVTNKDYAAAFPITPPEFTIRALGLNCGVYDPKALIGTILRGIARDYFGGNFDFFDPRLKVLEAIDDNYPPTYITTSYQDFLKDHGQSMYDFLTQKNVCCKLDIYGSETDKTVGHGFHLAITHPEAIRCNDNAAAFFHQVLAK